MLKNKRIITFLLTYWSIYLIITEIVQPIGWFGGQKLMDKIGVSGNVVILILPIIISVVLILYKNYNSGVISISDGSNRGGEYFQNLEKSAKNKIFIVGIGLTNLSRYATNSLKEYAKKVPIDLLMINPDYLEKNPEFAMILEEFLNIKNFKDQARISFDTLKKTCEEVNLCSNLQHMRLRVYEVIPSASVLLLDHDYEYGRIIIEFFLYHSGEKRPRIVCKDIGRKDTLYNIIKERYIELWNNSKEVIR